MNAKDLARKSFGIILIAVLAIVFVLTSEDYSIDVKNHYISWIFIIFGLFIGTFSYIVENSLRKSLYLATIFMISGVLGLIFLGFLSNINSYLFLILLTIIIPVLIILVLFGLFDIFIVSKRNRARRE